MRFFFIQLLFFLILYPISTFANNKNRLWGQVRDANGNPVIQAVVMAENTPHGVTTDNKGNYQLSLAPGRYEISVISLGFVRYQKVVNIKTDIKMDVALELDNIALQSVDILGKTMSQQVRETAYAINAIDVKSVVNSQSNLSDIIGRSNGINIRTEGGLGSNFDLSINGLSGNSVRYFIDGVPFSTLGNNINVGNLPLNIIDRTEVYKGVVPIQLGSDALGGAINIITKKQTFNYVDISYGCGSFDTHRADFNAQFKQKQTGLIVRPSLGFNHSANNYTMHGVEVWDTVAKAFQNTSVKRFHDAYTSAIGRLEIGLTDKKWADALFFSGSVSQVDNELQTGSIQSVVYGQAASNTQSKGLSISYRKTDFITKNLTTNLSYSHTWDHETVVDTAFRKYRWDGTYIESARNEITGRAKSLRHIQRPLDLADIGFSYPWNDNNSLSLHYSFNCVRNNRYDDVDTEFMPSDDKFAKHITGLSYNREWLGMRMSNLFFVKNYTSQLSVEQQDLYWITGSSSIAGTSTTSHWGGGSGLRFRLTEALAVKASYEYAVRLPLAREFLGNGTTIYPNLILKPEHSNNANFGLFGTVKISPNHRLDYEVNSFLRKIEDYIRLKVSESEGMSQYDNISNVSVTGIESEFRYFLGKTWDVTANASYLNEINKTKYQANGKPEITYNNRMPNRPWLYSNLLFNYYHHDLFGIKESRFQLSYDLRYVHWFYLTWEGYGALKSKAIIPAQFVSNAVATWSWCKERYNLSLACNNLLDRTVYDNYMLQKPGRSYFLKFRYFINS